MGYTNRAIPDDPSMFPPPQQFLVWIQEIDYKNSPYGRGWIYVPKDSGEGKVRHHYDLHSARKAVQGIGSKGTYRDESQKGVYYTNWRIYEWVEGEWVLRYSGDAGTKRDDNPLSKLRLKPGEKVNPIDKAIEEKAIESLLSGPKSA